MKTVVKSIPQNLLILLFIYAASSKLLSFDEFRGQMLNQVFPMAVASVLVYVLPAAELIIVLLLLLPKQQFTGLWASMGLLCCFTVYTAMVLMNFWPRVPCSCGGVLNHMGWQAHFVFNVVFVLINLCALYLHNRDERNIIPVKGYL